MRSDDNYKYSIVVPTHNSSGFIKTLLNSIPDVIASEVILIDDHSRDYGELEAIVKSYQSSVKNITMTLLKNTGIPSAGSARNIGINYASGEWLILADSDDIFTPDLSRAMLQYADNSAEVVIFQATSQKIDTGLPSDRTEYINYCFSEFTSNTINAQTLSFRITPVWSKFFKLDAVKNIKFRPTKVANDVGWSALSSFRTRKNIVIDLEKKIYLVNERQGSITRTKRYNFNKVARRMYERYRADTWLTLSVFWHDKSLAKLGRSKSMLRKYLIKRR